VFTLAIWRTRHHQRHRHLQLPLKRAPTTPSSFLSRKASTSVSCCKTSSRAMIHSTSITSDTLSFDSKTPSYSVSCRGRFPPQLVVHFERWLVCMYTLRGPLRRMACSFPLSLFRGTPSGGWLISRGGHNFPLNWRNETVACIKGSSSEHNLL
jgi:hypothetical protein